MKVQRNLVIAFLGAILLAVVFFMFGLKPKMTEISETKEQVTAAEAEGASIRSQIRRLEAVRDQAPELRAKLNTVASYLPSSAALPGFIRQIQTAATRADVDLLSIAPSPPSDLAGATGVQQINVTILVRGGYFRVQDLLARVENLPRIVQVSSLSLAPDPVNGGLQSTLTLKMYVVQEDARVTAAARSSPAASPAPSPSASP